MMRVMSVENDNPHATDIPRARHISEPSPLPTAIGIIPMTVVRVVIRIGRRRERPEITMALTRPRAR